MWLVGVWTGVPSGVGGEGSAVITRGWFKGGAVVGGWSLEGGVVFPLFSDGSAAVRGWQLGWRLGVLFDVGGEGSTVIVSRRLEDGVEGSAVIESK